MAQRNEGLEELRRANARLVLVNDIVAGLGACSTLDEVAVSVAQRLAEAFPDRSASVSSLGEDGRLRLRVAAGAQESRPPVELSLADAPGYARALREENVVRVPDTGTDPRLSALGEALGAAGVRALLSLGLPGPDGETQVVSLTAAGPTSWTDDDATTLIEVGAFLFLSLQEILHRKAREEALKALEVTAGRLGALVDSVAAGVLVEDEERRVVLANAAFCRIFELGRDPAGLVGRPARDVLEETRDRFLDPDAVLPRIEAVVDERRRLIGEELRLAGGRTVERDYIPIETDEGYQGHFWVFRDITVHKRTEENLRWLGQLEAHLVALSTRFINLPSGAIGSAIEQALSELAHLLSIDGAQLYLLSEDGTRYTRSRGWMAPEFDPGLHRPDELRGAELPELSERVGNLEIFRVESVAELQDRAPAEQAMMRRVGIESLLVVPISTRGELLGFVALATLETEHRWGDEVVGVLRMVGDVFGGALDRKRTEEELARTHRALEATNRALEHTNRKMGLLNEMGDLLLTSGNMEEAEGVLSTVLPQMFEGFPGVAYLHRGSERAGLEPVAAWGEGTASVTGLVAEDCWALRRGRPHLAGAGHGGPLCPHARGSGAERTLCLPLIAQGELLGLLHLRRPGGGAADEVPRGLRSIRQLAYNTAEQLSLGFANLHLRESLRSQALHDPLTGLPNRRYLEERLGRELLRARRNEAPLAVLMADLDHFKRINDVHGHAAGDRALARVARYLEESIRGEDVAARYGGEEFTLVLAGTGGDDARWVAEKLRQGVGRLDLDLGEGSGERVTLSVGVASFPDSGLTVEELLEGADAALYQAKREGRDRVVMSPPTDEGGSGSTARFPSPA